MFPDRSFLRHASYTVSGAYKLVEWTRLSPSVQEKLGRLYDTGNVYGLFSPVDGAAHDPKIAYREAALLYLHLQYSSRLPHYLQAGTGSGITTWLCQLVLDNILQISWQGVFVGGVSAVPALFPAVAGGHQPVNHLSRLSLDAIAYGLHLQGLTALELATKLYTYHTTPFDFAQRDAFATAHSVYQFIYAGSAQGLRETTEKAWRFSATHAGAGWLTWSRGAFYTGNRLASEPVYKLYLSPVPSHLPPVYQIAMPLLTGGRAVQVKIGASLEGILRPDKMVAYFETKENLLETASVLREALTLPTAQGVPFTSQLDNTGLLSWAIDPPFPGSGAGANNGSWRTEVTSQLAMAILRAQAENLPLPQALGFIRAQLYTAGISADDWSLLDENKGFE